MGQNDLYMRIKVNDGGNEVFNKRHPSSGDLGNHNVVDVNMNIPPVITPNAVKDVVLSVDVWDADPGNDDHLGKWNKVLNAANAWGLAENQGILSSGSFSKIKNITASVKPVVDVTALSETQKWWGVRNRGTDDISRAQYAAAFRDVDSDPESWDITDWLDKAFYAAVAKDVAENGNCFGMSLESIYARKGASLYSLPLDRFTNWDTIRSEVNVKHCYQVGAAPIWWFVEEFITGNTHDPKDVFRKTRSEGARGNLPIICLAQNYDFSGAPHAVLAVGWDDSTKPWNITILDPNFPAPAAPRTLTVNPDDNTFSYAGASSYSGGAWSGGRFHYIPWQLLSSRERTPVWDAILLLLAGTIVILGDDLQTTTITDTNGNDIDGFGERAKTELQARRPLDDFFVPFNAYNRVAQPTVTPTVLLAALRAHGKGAVAGEIMGRLRRRNREATVGTAVVHPSVITHLPIGSLSASRELRTIRDVVAATGGAMVADRTLHHIAADDRAMASLTPAAREVILTALAASRPGDYRHHVVGRRAGQFVYAVKHGLGQFMLESTTADGERTEVGIADMGTSKQTVKVKGDRNKKMKLHVENKLGLAKDRVRVTIDQIPIETGKELHMNLKPGLGGLDIVTNTAGATAPVEVEAVIGGKTIKRRFDVPLEGGVRVKLSHVLSQNALPVSRIDKIFGPAREVTIIPGKP